MLTSAGSIIAYYVSISTDMYLRLHEIELFDIPIDSCCRQFLSMRVNFAVS